MWSHYAEQHQGVVLGFRTEGLENAFQRPVEPVAYCEQFPNLIHEEAWAESIIYGLPVPPLKDNGRGWALSKSKEWEYEQEWRFVWIAPRGTSGTFEDFSFPPDSLTELTLGCKAAR